jgi:hypothetical protein
MATLGTGLDISKYSCLDDKIEQYLFCSIKNGKVTKTKIGEYSDGVSLDEYVKDDSVLLRSLGSAKVKCGGNISDGDFVASDANGCAIKYQDGHFILGKALESGVDGQIIEIYILKFKTEKKGKE